MARMQATIRVKLELGTPPAGCLVRHLPPALGRHLALLGICTAGREPAGVLNLGEITACPRHVDVAAVAQEAADRVAQRLHGTVVEG